MDTTKLSSKGQIVLPKSIRDALDWPVGAELIIEKGDDSVTIRRREAFPRKTVDDVAGSLAYDGPPVSLADMQKAVEDELAERWRRKRR